MNCVVGLDIGTTSTIGVVLNTLNHKIIFQSSRSVKLYSKKTGWAEEDPNQWWLNTQSILNEIGFFSKNKKINICSIGVTGMLPALVILDKNNQVIRYSIQQSDSRVEKELKSIFKNKKEKENFTKSTKCGVNQQLIAPKVLWLKKNEPHNYKKINKILGSYDYINYKLSGCFNIEHNWALESGLINFKSKNYSNELLKLGKIKKSWMPPISSSEKIIGTLKDSIAKKTSLPKNIPIISGCADHIVSAFTAGVKKSGDVLLKFGGAGDIMIATNKPFEDTRLFNDYHIIPGLYMPNGCMATSGSLLNWFLDLVNNDKKKLNHSSLDKLISKRSHLKTTCIILPYFLGEKTPIHDTNAKGTITGLTLNHNIEDLWIAFLESICFAFNHHLEVLKENKIKIDNIFASDGGSKSKVWMQIMSNVIQKNISVVEGHHGSSKGVAFLAAKSVDLYTSYEQSSLLNKQNKIIRFQKEYSNYYKKKYLIFKKLYTSLIDLYPKINELSQ